MHSNIHNPSTSHLSSNSITYRNAIYQGSIDQFSQKRNDFGIIYLAKTHQFICCNNWHNDNPQGQTLFYNSDQRYIYGSWINNQPQGFNVFRFQEILFMAEFYRGQLPKNTRILIIFEKYNLAVILIVTNQTLNFEQLQFQIYKKQQVFSSDDILTMFKYCQWPEEYFNQSQTLIKYISNRLINLNLQSIKQKNKLSSVKLRLIQNKYYRFGYDQGLAIIFDQNFNRISVGYNNKSKLTSFGVVFDKNPSINKSRVGQIYQKKPSGSIIGYKQLDKQKRSQQSSQKIYNTNLLMGVNFCNKFYKNSSKLYQYFIHNIINDSFVRNLVAGSLSTRKLFEEQSLNFSGIAQNQFNNNSSADIMFKNQDLPLLIQPVVFEKKKAKIQQMPINQRPSRVRFIQEAPQNQKITQDKYRLQQIKKQIYDSLQRRNSASQRKVMHQQLQKSIINREIVGKKNKNFQQNYFTPQRSVSKSRSRKRIFEQSQKNLQMLKDFTPSKSQKNLTPFKTKMKNRIFSGQFNKSQMREYIQSDNNYKRNKNVTSKEDIYQNSQQQQHIKDMSKFSSDKNEQLKIQSRNRIKQRESRASDIGSFYRNSKVNKDNQQTFEHKFNHSKTQEISSIPHYMALSKNSYSGNKQSIQGSRNHSYVPINAQQQKIKKSVMGNTLKKEYPLNNTTEANNFHRTQSVSFADPRIQKIQKQSSRHYQDTFYNLNQQQQYQNKSIENHRNNIPSIPKSKYYIQDYETQRNRQKNLIQQGRRLQSNIKKSQKKLTISMQNDEKEKENKLDQRKSINKVKSQKNHDFRQDTQKDKSIYKNIRVNLQNENNIQQQKRPVFKHSNQVYLKGQINTSPTQSYNYTFDNQRSPIRINKQNKKHQYSYSNQIVHKQPQSKANQSYMMGYHQKTSTQNPKNISKQNTSSYTTKYRVKKQIQKQIQKSPDRYRCYGNTSNNPYLQGTQRSNRSKQYSYHFDNSYQNNQSPSKNKYGQKDNYNRQSKNRLF